MHCNFSGKMSGKAFWLLSLMIMNGNNHTLEFVATLIGSLLIASLLFNYVIMPKHKDKMAEFTKVVKELTGGSTGMISTRIVVPTNEL
jgi:hypothetical protein